MIDKVIKHSQRDELVQFNDGEKALLVSQIGYTSVGVRVAYLTSQTKAVLDGVEKFEVLDASMQVVYESVPEYAGEWVQAHFAKLDFSAVSQPGNYRIRVGALVSNEFEMTTAQKLYLDDHYHGMMIGQMEIRKRMDAVGGFIDCGNDIRETNSHATQVRGYTDVTAAHPRLLSEQEQAELDEILRHSAAFLAGQQQDSGLIEGGWWFTKPIDYMGKWANHIRGVFGFLRLADHFASTDEAFSKELLQAAERALQYSREHSAPEDTRSTFATLRLWNEAEYHRQANDALALAEAKAIAGLLRKRQLKQSEALDSGIYGLFRMGADVDNEYARLNHHKVESPYNGEYWGLPLHGLLILSSLYPEDSDAAMWRDTVKDFTDGFLKQGCMASPMKLLPNGVYGDEGDEKLLWFSDLYHGQSMTYGMVASDMIAYGNFLGDSTLVDLAEHQLLWIGGLNTGANFPNAAEPFSCIVGKGYQWLSDGLGEFKYIPGSVVNGLSATRQFRPHMPEGPEMPVFLCDESWISHTGGWLSGVSALLAAR